MLLIVAFLAGGVFGWYRASRRQQKLADRIHAAAVYGILFFVVTLLVSVIVSWQME